MKKLIYILFGKKADIVMSKKDFDTFSFINDMAGSKMLVTKVKKDEDMFVVRVRYFGNIK